MYVILQTHRTILHNSYYNSIGFRWKSTGGHYLDSTVIVDDNEDIANVLSDIVEIGGLNVVGIGYSGKEAVTLYSKYKPDVMFLDVVMPKMNGIEALKEIKHESSNTKIIMITADGSLDVIKELEKLNVDAIVVKPFKIDMIFQTIKHLAQKQPRQLKIEKEIKS